MVQRGRKSVASLAIVPASAALPKAPAELSADEAELWDAIVGVRGRFPPPTDRLLIAYISHAVTARALAKRVREVGSDYDVRALNRLLAMHARETAAMSRLASKLKLLPPRQRSPQVLPKPWDLV
jgi:hypothetical protein